MHLTPEDQEALLEASKNDSTIIIEYLEEQEKRQRPYNISVLLFSVIAAIGSVIGAVVAIIGLFK